MTRRRTRRRRQPHLAARKELGERLAEHLGDHTELADILRLVEDEILDDLLVGERPSPVGPRLLLQRERLVVVVLEEHVHQHLSTWRRATDAFSNTVR